MSTIQFSGIATGLDTASIVSQLVAIRRQPIDRLEQRKALLEKQTAALTDLQAKLDVLRDAAAALDTAREFAANAASSSHESMVRVSADSLAAPGSYRVVVQNLASRQKDVTQGYATLQDVVGGGTFSLTVGGEVHSLTLADGATLSDLRDAINASGLDVQASVMNDGNATAPYRLILTAVETGVAAGFEADFSGLAGGTAPALTRVSEAADASLLIDSIPVTSPDNSLGSAITGLSFDLLAADPATEITVTVDSDAEEIADRVQAFVDAYNDVLTYLDAQSADGGTLRGHPAVRSVTQRLQSLVVPAGTSTGRYRMLAEVGVKLTEDGHLELDRAKFQNALAESYDDVRDLFVSGTDTTGKAELVRTAIEQMTSSVDGLFKISRRAISDKIDSIEESIARYERGVEAYQESLERQFTAMESLVSSLQAQGNYLTMQMSSLLLNSSNS